MFSFARHSKSKISNWWWTVDKVTFSLTVFLIFIGAMLVLSASPSAANRDHLADDFAFIKKQGNQRGGAVDKICRFFAPAVRVCQADVYCGDGVAVRRE